MTDTLTHLIERAAVTDVVTSLFIATDTRDWAAVRECFAPRVHFDVTSLAGGRPADMTGEEIAAGWEQGLRQLQAIHHQVGNFRVHIEAKRATVTCYGVAYHYARARSGRNTRTFVGTYDFELERTNDRWHITLFRFNVKFVDGNLELEADAAAPEPARA